MFISSAKLKGVAMTVIGITGPSGAGKGALCAILQTKYGFNVIDADSIYHSLVSAPSPCLDEIRLNFGDGVICQNGSLNREALSRLVFGDGNADRLRLLNKITHKYVVEKILLEIENSRSQGVNCLVDAPLLIEAELTQYCDFSISVLADDKTRIERIVARDNISYEKAAMRISSQKAQEFYTANTDYTVINDSDISLLESSALKILSERRVTI